MSSNAQRSSSPIHRVSSSTASSLPASSAAPLPLLAAVVVVAVDRPLLLFLLDVVDAGGIAGLNPGGRGYVGKLAYVIDGSDRVGRLRQQGRTKLSVRVREGFELDQFAGGVSPTTVVQADDRGAVAAGLAVVSNHVLRRRARRGHVPLLGLALFLNVRLVNRVNSRMSAR